MPIICSIVDALLTDKEFDEFARSPDLNESEVFERNANTAKVTIHTSKNPRSAAIKIIWVVLSDASMVSPLSSSVYEGWVE